MSSGEWGSLIGVALIVGMAMVLGALKR